MIDFEARQIIEAFRSGVSATATAQYFSFARPKLIAEATQDLIQLKDVGRSAGRIVSGKYGEGKTHFLNTIHYLAHEQNIVVSHISLSKETPFDKLNLVLQKVVNHTYLPTRPQPGFSHALECLTEGSPLALDLLEFAQNKLETNKIYTLLRAYLGTDNDDEKFMLLSDFEGDFISNATLKQIYKRIFSLKTALPIVFNKTKHCMDYFVFFSYFFQKLGYHGWVLLFDEAELIGRLGKKARMNAYITMQDFLRPPENRQATYSVFAITSSFAEDVIASKHEFDNLDAIPMSPEQSRAARLTLERIAESPQLAPLSTDEIHRVLEKVMAFHAKAYDWIPPIDVDALCRTTEKRGYLLRTRIRAAVESLDQLYQYGSETDITVRELGTTTYEETTSLDSLL